VLLGAVVVDQDVGCIDLDHLVAGCRGDGLLVDVSTL
jgi:hypothetical protein